MTVSSLQHSILVTMTMVAVLTSVLQRVMEHLVALVQCTWCYYKTYCTVEVNNTPHTNSKVPSFPFIVV